MYADRVQRDEEEMRKENSSRPQKHRRGKERNNYTKKKKKKKKLDPIAECNTGSDVQLFLKQEEDSALFHDFKFKKKS